MSADVQIAFLAYPSLPRDIGFCVRAAAQKANAYRHSVRIKGWEENDISGRLLTDPIFKQIEESPFIVADVTKLNFNVTFEIGYAIGTGERAFLIRNKALVGDDDIFIKTGIFDTLGYDEYANEDDLAKYLGGLWGQICISHCEGEETSQYLIERSLMRPRNLLKIFGHCRGFAVNLAHARIEEEDIRKGLKSYANDLVTEADRELTDIESAAEGLIYNFVGEGNSFSHADLEVLFEIAGITKEKFDPIIGFLLYYGFLGFSASGADPKYVFDYNYDMRMLTAVIQKSQPNLRYVLNPAFTPALSG